MRRSIFFLLLLVVGYSDLFAPAEQIKYMGKTTKKAKSVNVANKQFFSLWSVISSFFLCKKSDIEPSLSNYDRCPPLRK